ncbi:hypothetical protein HDU93_000786, partial [Gonapodya sp. JEL0774]
MKTESAPALRVVQVDSSPPARPATVQIDSSPPAALPEVQAPSVSINSKVDSQAVIAVGPPPGETISMGTFDHVHMRVRDAGAHGPHVDPVAQGSVNTVNVPFSSNAAQLDEDAEDVAVNREVEIGSFRSKVVGCRYYNGMAFVGEATLLVREPTNRYDANAIRVDNVAGTQVGHIPREIASIVAPLMDDKSVRLEGTVAGNKGVYEMPLDLSFFSQPENAPRLLNHLRSRGVTLRLIRAPQPTPSAKPLARATIAEAAWAAMLGKGKKITPENSQEVLGALGLSAQDLSNLPEAPQPASLVTPLLPYQKQGVCWLLQAEHPPAPELGKPSQFWEKRRGAEGEYYYNVTTGFGMRQPPQLMRGGVLADDMGLGKTIQIISLILTDSAPTAIIPNATASPSYSNATLIVAPLSVIGNWEDQIARHVDPVRGLKIHVFHDRGKALSKKDLELYDVVITTSATLANSSKLSQIKWRRVVLDEGHFVRSKNSMQAKKVCELQAERRWVVSGTPIQNDVDDLYGIVKFLQLDVFTDIGLWRRTFSRPVKEGLEEGIARLK